MRNFFLFILISAFLAGCSSESPLSRLSEEYFPLPDTSSYWNYKDTLGNSASVSVESFNFLYQSRYCSVWDFNGTYFYVWKDDGSIKTHNNLTRDFAGTSYVVENRWADFLKLPLLDGDLWTDVYTNNINIAGDPYSIEIKTTVSVRLLENFTCPEGSYENCYRIDINRKTSESSILLGNQTSSENKSYILAPSKGMVFFSDSTGDYFLTELELI